MHFFDISTSKSSPRPPVFNTFYVQMCFAPQRRTLFRHLNVQNCAEPSVFNTFYFQMCFAPQRHALFQHLDFQKWSGAEVFCTFSLRNRLRATTCNFSSLISPDVSAPAALASLLFDPPEPQNHEETQCFATFPPFRAPASSFFWSFLFGTHFSMKIMMEMMENNGNDTWKWWKIWFSISTKEEKKKITAFF